MKNIFPGLAIQRLWRPSKTLVSSPMNRLSRWDLLLTRLIFFIVIFIQVLFTVASALAFPPPPSLMNQLWRCEARSVINSSSLSFVQCPLLLFTSFKSSENQNKTFAEQDPFKLLIPQSDEHPPLRPAQLRQGREGYDPHEAWGDNHLNQDNQWGKRKINVRLFVQFESVR